MSKTQESILCVPAAADHQSIVDMSVRQPNTSALQGLTFSAVSTLEPSSKVSSSIINEQLEQAVWRRDVETLRTLLNLGADPAARRGKAFFDAATSGFAEGAKLLFERHGDRDETLKDLVKSAYERLCENSPKDVETKNLLSTWSAAQQKVDFTEAASDVDRNPRPEVIQKWIDRGIMQETYSIVDNFVVAVAKSGNIGLLIRQRVLHQHFASITLCRSAAYGHLEDAKYLVEYGADVNYQPEESYDPKSDRWRLKSPICGALMNGHLNVVKFLYSSGADLNRIPLPMNEITDGGHWDVLQFLRDNGAMKSYQLETQIIRHAEKTNEYNHKQKEPYYTPDDRDLYQSLSKKHLDIVKRLCTFSPDFCGGPAYESGEARGTPLIIEKEIRNNTEIHRFILDNFKEEFLRKFGSYFEFHESRLTQSHVMYGLIMGRSDSESSRNYSRELFSLIQSHFLERLNVSERVKEALYSENEFCVHNFYGITWLIDSVAGSISNDRRERIETADLILKNQLAAFEQSITENPEFSLQDEIKSILGLGYGVGCPGGLNLLITRVAEELVLPKLAKSSDILDISQLRRTAHSMALESIIGHMDLQSLNKLARFMKTPRATLPSDLQPLRTRISWYPLFEGHVELSDGYSIVALSNEEDLKNALKNALNKDDQVILQSARRCAAGQSQILYLKSKSSDSFSLIELKIDPNSPVVFESSKDHKWSVASPRKLAKPLQKAFWEFITLARRGEIEFNPSFGRYNAGHLGSFSRSLSPVEQITGIPENEPDLMDRIVKFWKDLALDFGEPIVDFDVINLL